MNSAALLPLVFWLVVGLLVGFLSGRASVRRKMNKAIRDIPREREKRANIAAVPHYPSGFAQFGHRAPTPPHIRRNRTDPDATVELHEVKPDNPWTGFPLENDKNG